MNIEAEKRLLTKLIDAKEVSSMNLQGYEITRLRGEVRKSGGGLSDNGGRRMGKDVWLNKTKFC